MTPLRTLLFAFMLPALVLPDGITVCLCQLFHGDGAPAACSTCEETCSRTRDRSDAPVTTASANERDCFLHVPVWDRVARESSTHDGKLAGAATSAPSHDFGIDGSPALLAPEPVVRPSLVPGRWRISTIPLFESALPLRL